MRLARASATPSMARMTPSRTPNKSNSNPNLVPMTAEKEKAPVDDKLFIQAKTQKVLEELAKRDGFAELVQKGLKSMTHKQFINILQIFLKPLVGSISFDGTNYIEYIHNFLNSMDYPYTINKSSLKTPTAPHCSHNIVILLAWLSEFSVYESEVESIIKYTPSDDFQSCDVSRMYMLKTTEAFFLWNNQQESESDKVKEEIGREYVEAKIGSGGSLTTELTHLKVTINQLNSEAKPVSLHKDYIDKRDELKLLKQKSDELNKMIKDSASTLSNKREDLDQKISALGLVLQEHKILRKKLSRQKMTNEEKNRALMELSQAKAMLASKKTATMSLTEASSENEIQLSNLLQKKFLLIETLNNYIYKLSSDLGKSGLREDFNPSAFEIKTTKIDDAAGLEVELIRLQKGLRDLNDKYLHAIATLNHSLIRLDTIKHQEYTKLERLSEKMKLSQVSLEQAITEETGLENELRQMALQAEESFQMKRLDIKQLIEDIEILKKNIAELYESNAQIAENKASFKARSLEECKQLFETRKQEVELNRKRLADMKNLIEKCTKRPKPFTDDVQKTIDAVLNKRGQSQDENE